MRSWFTFAVRQPRVRVENVDLFVVIFSQFVVRHFQFVTAHCYFFRNGYFFRIFLYIRSAWEEITCGTLSLVQSNHEKIRPSSTPQSHRIRQFTAILTGRERMCVRHAPRQGTTTLRTRYHDTMSCATVPDQSPKDVTITDPPTTIPIGLN